MRVWQKGHDLVISIYHVTKSFPTEEKFSLTQQVRRSVESITSNIAEGFGRRTTKDKVHFYVMARGSVDELQNQLVISKDIELIAEDKFDKLYERTIVVHKLLNGLIKSIDDER